MLLQNFKNFSCIMMCSFLKIPVFSMFLVFKLPICFDLIFIAFHLRSFDV